MRSVRNEIADDLHGRLETGKQLVHGARRRLRLPRYSCKIKRTQAFPRSKLSCVDFASEIDQRRQTQASIGIGLSTVVAERAFFYVGGRYIGEPGKELMYGQMYVSIWIQRPSLRSIRWC